MNASDNTHGEFREETAPQTGWSRKAAWRRRQVLTARTGWRRSEILLGQEGWREH